MSALTLGLTGGLAAGKSTVARRLGEAGFAVFDADQLVAESYGPGGPGSQAVRELFGPELLAADGSVDKRRLAGLVFRDDDARRRLEAAVHPLVRRQFAAAAARIPAVAVLEATRLVEAGFAADLEAVVDVEAPEELRLERAVARGLGRDDARARLAAQGDGESRRAAAHFIVANDGDRAALDRRLAVLVGAIRRRSWEVAALGR
jgi:dephospho-CoA kinase